MTIRHTIKPMANKGDIVAVSFHFLTRIERWQCMFIYLQIALYIILYILVMPAVPSG